MRVKFFSGRYDKEKQLEELEAEVDAFLRKIGSKNMVNIDYKTSMPSADDALRYGASPVTRVMITYKKG